MSFDKTDVFKEHFEPLVEEIRKKAVLLDMPMFMSFATKDDGETTTYVNYMVSERDAGVKLSDNHLVEHANVFNGFKTTMNKNITMDDDFIKGYMDGMNGDE